MIDRKHYIMHEDGSFEAVSLERWAEWFETGNRRVALDEKKGVTVSTVFLGIDHSFGSGPGPVLFETMVFDKDGNDAGQWRYRTRDEALKGHAAVVREWLVEDAK